MKKLTTKILARMAITAALYVALSLVFAPISFGPWQFRVSEILTILPLFYFESIWGLAIGCFLANIVSGPIDMFIGAAATLVAAVMTYKLKNIFLGILPPIIINAFAVPIIFLLVSDDSAPYIVNVLTIAIGQAGVLIAGGIPFYFGLKKVQKRALFLR